jgi:hypothetical protein
MRRPKVQPIRNKVDLADRVQVRIVRRRFGLTEAELTTLVGRIGNSITAIAKEIQGQRAAKLPTPAEVPPAALVVRVSPSDAALTELVAAGVIAG